jgi:hypothetical protein
VDGEVGGGEERQVAVPLRLPNLAHAVFSLRK